MLHSGEAKSESGVLLATPTAAKNEVVRLILANGGENTTMDGLIFHFKTTQEWDKCALKLRSALPWTTIHPPRPNIGRCFQVTRVGAVKYDGTVFLIEPCAEYSCEYLALGLVRSSLHSGAGLN